MSNRETEADREWRSRTARIVHFGGSPKQLQADDWLMLLALGFYTTELVSINITATASSNLLPPGYLETHRITQQEIDERTYGSKMTVVTEQCQCVTIWLIKICLLIMYYRITYGAFPKQNIAVRILMAYVGITFIAMEICYFTVWCRPFHDYWKVVPIPSIQCSAAIHHLITNAAFNLSSDVAMLGIALPMFLRSHLPLQRKLTLCVIFGLGIFVILSAVLNKYYSFTDPFGVLWTYWYVRESSTAMLVANLPFLWGLVRKVFGLREEDEARSALSIRRGKGVLPNLRRKFSIIPGLKVSAPTATGTLFTSGISKTKHSEDTSGHSGSPMLGRHSQHGSIELQHFDAGRSLSPGSLEHGRRAASRSSSRLSNQRPSSLQMPASRLEAEIMIDDGIPSPRLPFARRDTEQIPGPRS